MWGIGVELHLHSLITSVTEETVIYIKGEVV